MFTHAYADIDHPVVTCALISRLPAKTLVVFVHGWSGSAVETWGEFIRPPSTDWWEKADLIFIDYDSVKQQVASVANVIRRAINDIYPKPFQKMLFFENRPIRDETSKHYDELFLVGHSMGGLVLRRALVDALDEWKNSGYAENRKSAILDGKLRLFSPASAGFFPSGPLAVMQSLPFWLYVEIFLKQGASYRDLQPDSSIIMETRRRTEMYHDDQLKKFITADILWANPENIVKIERYDTDSKNISVNSATHQTVCKPNANYSSPWEFVEHGDLL